MTAGFDVCGSGSVWLVEVVKGAKSHEKSTARAPATTISAACWPADGDEILVAGVEGGSEGDRDALRSRSSAVEAGLD